MFLAKKIIAALLLPPLSPLLLIALGLLLVGRHPRTGRTLAWSGFLLLLLLSTAGVTSPFLHTLEDYPPITSEQLRRAQAIVVLGAGLHYDAPEYQGDTVDRLALERLRYAARLARQSGLPVLVTAGRPRNERHNADVMAETLEQDFGVRVRWRERASRDTRENARFSAAILHGAGISRVVVVTHAWHMARALGEFRAAGLDPIPAPTGYSGEGPAWIPSRKGMEQGYFATHEWLGLLAQRVAGIGGEGK